MLNKIPEPGQCSRCACHKHPVRQRVEDLGRLLVMMEELVEHDLFEYDRSDRFIEKMADKDRLEAMCHHIFDVRDTLYTCLAICKGQDDLNDPYL